MPAIAVTPVTAAVPIAVTRVEQADPKTRCDDDWATAIGTAITRTVAVTIRTAPLARHCGRDGAEGCANHESGKKNLSHDILHASTAGGCCAPSGNTLNAADRRSRRCKIVFA